MAIPKASERAAERMRAGVRTEVRRSCAGGRGRVLRWAGGLAGLCLAGCTLAGCNAYAIPPIHVDDRSAYVAEQTRVFAGVTREQLLQAAETVVRSSGGQYEFVYGLNGFSARRPYFVYGVLGSAFGRDRWDVDTEPTPAGLRASVTVADAGDLHGGLSPSRYETVATDTSVYARFWGRVEGVLGRGAEPVVCDAAVGGPVGRVSKSTRGPNVLCALRDGFRGGAPVVRR